MNATQRTWKSLDTSQNFDNDEQIGSFAIQNNWKIILEFFSLFRGESVGSDSRRERARVSACWCEMECMQNTLYSERLNLKWGRAKNSEKLLNWVGFFWFNVARVLLTRYTFHCFYGNFRWNCIHKKICYHVPQPLTPTPPAFIVLL